MSYRGQIVVDADCHLREYWDLDRTYKAYIDPQYRQTYEAFSAAVRAHQRRPGDVGFEAFYAPPPLRPLGVGDHFVAPRVGQGNGPATSAPRAPASGRYIDPACNWDPVVRLRDFDQADIDVGVMFSSQSDNFCALRDVGFERAIERAYHRFMHDFCAESDGRLRWLSNAVVRDISSTVDELTYWAERDENYAGVFIPRLLADGRLLDVPDLYPLWQHSQDLDLPIWNHGDPYHPPLTPGSKDLDNAAFSRPVLKGWGAMTAAGGMIGGGVFDLFPRLRVGFFENGCGWLPWFIEKLDDSWQPGSSNTPNMKRKPSEIVADGQIFCSVDTAERDIGHCVERLGEHVCLFSTDYPHSANPWPEGVAEITERTDLSETAKVKILGANAVRFLPRLAK
ncbi:MAG: amidohydrolase family protein [Chloroflexi bacterium]|nr:amidohydrolase family protein [Chloroflexota bacterium]